MREVKNILVVAAHGDDEVLGCGATIAAHTAQGDRVFLLIMTDGVTSRYFDYRKGKVSMTRAIRTAIERRGRETAKAAKMLGIAQGDITQLRLADQRLDALPLLTLIKHIEAARKKCDPDIVYTHFYGDLNVDHRLTCEAALTAFRPCPDGTGAKIYLFEVPESTSLAPSRGFSFRPNVFRPAGKKEMAAKLNALAAYESESRVYPHPRSREYMMKNRRERFLKVQ